MATNYVIRRWCEDCGSYKFEDQTDVTFDPSFEPVECSGHTLRDGVIVEEEEV